MTRSKWKGPSIQQSLFLKKNIITRNIEIVPKFIGFTYSIYNGKNYVSLIVTENMVGHKFGEFSFTRFNKR